MPPIGGKSSIDGSIRTTDRKTYCPGISWREEFLSRGDRTGFARETTHAGEKEHCCKP